MHDKAALMVTLQEFIAAFNNDRMDDSFAAFADNVSVVVNTTSVAANLEEFKRAVTRARATGWTAQRVLAASAQDNVVIYHYRNEFADGPTRLGSGALGFDDTGKISIVRSIVTEGSALESTNP